jgi:hypothetical protein
MKASTTAVGEAVATTTAVLVSPPTVYVVVKPPVMVVDCSPLYSTTRVTPPMTAEVVVPPEMKYLVTVRTDADALVSVADEIPPLSGVSSDSIDGAAEGEPP